MKYLLFATTLLFAYCTHKKSNIQTEERITNLSVDKHRPHFHFTPDSMWMNDPNGMVYYKNTYHLFYQYYPDSTVWGPMHWGHATSPDMITWTHQPIALYPDEHGYIFSGSAVLDLKNTSGFGTSDNPPLVAIFTYHNPERAKKDLSDVESQGIAYSLDDGKTWKKYKNNPVLHSPGMRDFRDPKVRWYTPAQRWIMTLAVKDHIRFYASPDLKNWHLASRFGDGLGAHGGVWECPDLFPLNFDGKQYWILVVNLNPGGPNGGSATQYFVGDFDGERFSPADSLTRWLDYGPDEYAGVTWSNTGSRTLFIGWMSNWKYATLVPTKKWRSAMTLARELSLDRREQDYVVRSMPVSEFEAHTTQLFAEKNLEIHDHYNLTEAAGTEISTFELDLSIKEIHGFKVLFSNDQGNKLSVRYDQSSNKFTIDRSLSGEVSFHNMFAKKIVVPRWSHSQSMKLKFIADAASLELFADKGSTVSTCIFFPDQPLDKITIVPHEPLTFSTLELKKVE